MSACGKQRPTPTTLSHTVQFQERVMLGQGPPPPPYSSIMATTYIFPILSALCLLFRPLFFALIAPAALACTLQLPRPSRSPRLSRGLRRHLYSVAHRRSGSRVSRPKASPQHDPPPSSRPVTAPPPRTKFEGAPVKTLNRQLRSRPPRPKAPTPPHTPKCVGAPVETIYGDWSPPQLATSTLTPRHTTPHPQPYLPRKLIPGTLDYKVEQDARIGRQAPVCWLGHRKRAIWIPCQICAAAAALQKERRRAAADNIGLVGIETNPGPTFLEWFLPLAGLLFCPEIADFIISYAPSATKVRNTLRMNLPGLGFSDPPAPTQVIQCWIVCGTKVLLTTRGPKSSNTAFIGTDSGVGGKIESGQDLREAAIRECDEELNLDITNCGIVVGHVETVEAQDYSVAWAVVYSDDSPPVVTNEPGKVDNPRWTEIGDVDLSAMHPSTAAAFQTCLPLFNRSLTSKAIGAFSRE
jgi:8-oxo-dGTP pyrophosphatase MutT (NUDIX family)